MKKKIIIFCLVILIIIASCFLIFRQSDKKTIVKTTSLLQKVESNFGEKVIIPKSYRAEVTAARVISASNGKGKDIEITYGVKDNTIRNNSNNIDDLLYGDYTKDKIGTLVISHGTQNYKEISTDTIGGKKVYYGLVKRDAKETVVFYTYNVRDIHYTLTVTLNDNFDKQDARLIMEQIALDGVKRKTPLS